jgi:hypothetical protein
MNERIDLMKNAIALGEEVGDGLRCSVCRKKIRTPEQRVIGRIGIDVCVCEHHWLNDTTYEPPIVMDIRPLDTA